MFSEHVPMRRVEGLALFALGIALYAHGGHSWLMFGLLFFLPDLGIAGYWISRKFGAASYNLTHWLVWPLALGAAGVWTGSDLLQALALIWGAHVGFDRLLGWGLKSPKSFCHTDMGLKEPIGSTPQLQP